MTINSLTGKPLKHYAQDEITKERYVVIALQNDTDPNTCSVVPYDNLDSDMRSELLAAVNSDECQHVPEIWKILDRKFFMNYPNQTMLAVLRALKQIRVVEENRVKIELPNDMVMTPKQILKAINDYEAEKNSKTSSRFHVESANNMQTSVPQDNAKITEMETRINSMEEKLNTINSSISDLVAALKQNVKVGE